MCVFVYFHHSSKEPTGSWSERCVVYMQKPLASPERRVSVNLCQKKKTDTQMTDEVFNTSTKVCKLCPEDVSKLTLETPSINLSLSHITLYKELFCSVFWNDSGSVVSLLCALKWLIWWTVHIYTRPCVSELY